MYCILRYVIEVVMFCEKLRKISDKISEGIGNLRDSSAIPISNGVHRKAIFAATCVLTIVVLSAIMGNFSWSKTFVYAGSVKGLGVGIYWDQSCTNRTILLDWGPIAAGSNNVLTVYVKNEANSVVSLWLTTLNWAPSACLDYMSLSWNYSGHVLSVDQVVPLELTLFVYPTISGITDFSFNAIITTTSQG
jgi:hypothetical protein